MHSRITKTTFVLLAAAAAAGCGGGKTGDSAVAQRAPSSGYVDITAAQLHEMMQAKDFLLVNVHIPYAGDIPGTDLSIPFDQMAANLDRLPADRAARIVLYCRSGRMSREASEALVALGYGNVVNVVGGFTAWSGAGYPLEMRGEP